MTYFQVNGDGAGPLTAQIDYTSGGTSAAAFQNAPVLVNVPGTNSRSKAKTTTFNLQVQMPQGATCSGSVGGATNLCVVRVQNAARAGPFGGTGYFTMPETQGTAAAANTTAKQIRSIGKTLIIKYRLIHLQADESCWKSRDYNSMKRRFVLR